MKYEIRFDEKEIVFTIHRVGPLGDVDNYCDVRGWTNDAPTMLPTFEEASKIVEQKQFHPCSVVGSIDFVKKDANNLTFKSLKYNTRYIIPKPGRSHCTVFQKLSDTATVCLHNGVVIEKADFHHDQHVIVVQF